MLGLFVMLTHWSNFIPLVVIDVTSHGMLEVLAVGECVNRECNESAMPDCLGTVLCADL